MSVIDILSLFTDVFLAVVDVDVFAGVLTTVNIFLMASLGINISLTCLVRVLSLESLSFMEDEIGERLTRWLVLVLSLLAGVLASSVLLVSGGRDLYSGVNYSLITRQIIAAGWFYICVVKMLPYPMPSLMTALPICQAQ